MNGLSQMFCRNNWLTFDFDGLPKRQKHEVLNLHFNERAVEVLPLDEAAVKTAQDIGARYNNIYIAMSGGADSEYVAKAFKIAGVPFTAITMTCMKYSFLGEWYVDRWCEQNGVELVKVETHPEQLLEYSRQNLLRIKGISWFGVTVNIIADKVEELGGVMVTGAAPSYHPDPKLGIDKAEQGFADSFRGFMFDESDFYIELVNPGKHPWSFFYWSPEMLASFVSAWDTTQTGEENKARIYGTIPRPKLRGSELFTYNYLAWQLPEYASKFEWIKFHKKFNWGVRDFAACPDKEEFLKLLT